MSRTHGHGTGTRENGRKGGGYEYWGRLAAGHYDLRCRTIDLNGIAQPMPRPFPKSGRVAIQSVSLIVGE